MLSFIYRSSAFFFWWWCQVSLLRKNFLFEYSGNTRWSLSWCWAHEKKIFSVFAVIAPLSSSLHIWKMLLKNKIAILEILLLSFVFFKFSNSVYPHVPQNSLSKICVLNKCCFSNSMLTVYENHKKSLIQNCERSELRLQFE